MGGKGRKRREKNYVAAHGGTSRLPPPPNPSSINALPSKLRKIMSFTSSIGKGLGTDSDNTQRKRKRDDVDENSLKITDLQKRHSEAQSKSKSGIIRGERDKTWAMPQVADESKQSESGDANEEEEEEKKKKKRKKKQVNDLRFEAEMEKLGVVSKRRQRKKEYLKAKKKKHKKGSSDHQLDLPKCDEIKFGEVVQAPPKLAVIPKAFRQRMNASKERLRFQAIEAYRNRKGWTNRPGIQVPPVSTSSDL
ncbi:hypothetical protein Cgig2_013143 [Carnegiea gigantea]|uniref:Coiled-coil domain-containing protein 137 n=1 Tax=Carnegiea gigantea TaxID=171969 RepID=A0A9Q1KR78_9CARY|nr:hypothetical protein Cgig2_013143 [Carnegiea gigantea]